MVKIPSIKRWLCWEEATCTFILRQGYGPKAFVAELWEALKYVLPVSRRTGK